MPKVFVINGMTHDFSNAESYGKLVYVTEGKVPLFKTDVTRKMLKEGLVGFTADDYLVVSGPALMCMMATLLVSDIVKAEGATHIKTLVFEAKQQDYVCRHLLV